MGKFADGKDIITRTCSRASTQYGSVVFTVFFIFENIV